MNHAETKRMQAALQADFGQAEALVNELRNHLESWRFLDDLPSISEEKERFLRLQITNVLFRIKLRLMAAFDSLHFPSIATQIEARFSARENPDSMEELPWIGELVNPLLGELLEFYEVLNPYLPASSKNAEQERERSRLYGILAATPKMLVDRNIEPSVEKDVETAVYQSLIYFFPDTVSQIPIPKSVRTYKPDIGVRSLGTAIEYKFATSEQELKACLDGIFADIHGYADTKDWTHFVAVLYTTDHFFTQEQLKTHIESCGFPNNWTMIMVTGRGERTAKRPKSRSRKRLANGGAAKT